MLVDFARDPSQMPIIQGLEFFNRLYRYMEKDLEEEERTNRNDKRPFTPSPGHALPTALAAPLARRSQQTGQRWEYARVDQSDFEAQKPHALVEATQMSGQASGV